MSQDKAITRDGSSETILEQIKSFELLQDTDIYLRIA